MTVLFSCGAHLLSLVERVDASCIPDVVVPSLLSLSVDLICLTGYSLRLGEPPDHEKLTLHAHLPHTLAGEWALRDGARASRVRPARVGRGRTAGRRPSGTPSAGRLG